MASYQARVQARVQARDARARARVVERLASLEARMDAFEVAQDRLARASTWFDRAIYHTDTRLRALTIAVVEGLQALEAQVEERLRDLAVRVMELEMETGLAREL